MTGLWPVVFFRSTFLQPLTHVGRYVTVFHLRR